MRKDQVNTDLLLRSLRVEEKSQKIRFTPVFVDAFKTEPTLNNVKQEAFKRPGNWDFELTRENTAAAIFEILYRKVCENLVKDDLSPELFTSIKGNLFFLENLLMNVLPEKSSEWIDDKTTTETETFDTIVIR